MQQYFEDGISLFVNEASVMYASDKKITALPETTTSGTTPWALWGDDNLFCNRLIDDLKNTPVLSGATHMKVRMAIGKGFEPYLRTAYDPASGKETLEPVLDNEVLDWFEFNQTHQYSYANIYNMLGLGLSATQFVITNDRSKIAKIHSPDISMVRIGRKNKQGINEDIYLCADWESKGGASFNPDYQVKIPLLSVGNEYFDLKSRTSGFEFAVLHRLLLNGANEYPWPLWYAAHHWVDISRSIPIIKKAFHKNQMAIKYVIYVHNSYWEKLEAFKNAKDDKTRIEIKKAKHKEINDWLTGNENAGKTIVSGCYYDQVTKQMIKEIEIIVLDDKFKEGKMLPDNAVADKQILFSILFNPAILGSNLLGDGASGGGGSGSDIREAFLVLLMQMESERQMNAQTLNLVKRYNGWNRLESDSKRLVFRYDTSILTTLNTGGSLQNAKA